MDHRPPIIAFVVLVALAAALIGSNARAVDGHALALGPVGVQAHTWGTVTAAPSGQGAPARERANDSPSRAAVRTPVPAVPRAHHASQRHTPDTRRTSTFRAHVAGLRLRLAARLVSARVLLLSAREREGR